MTYDTCTLPVHESAPPPPAGDPAGVQHPVTSQRVRGTASVKECFHTVEPSGNQAQNVRKARSLLSTKQMGLCFYSRTFLLVITL